MHLQAVLLLVLALSVGLCSAASPFAVPQEIQEFQQQGQQQAQQQQSSKGTKSHSTYSGETSQQNSSSHTSFSGATDTASDAEAAAAAAAAAAAKLNAQTPSTTTTTSPSPPPPAPPPPPQPKQPTTNILDVNERKVEEQPFASTPDYSMPEVIQPQPQQPPLCQCPCASSPSPPFPTQNSMFSNNNWLQQKPSVTTDSDESTNKLFGQRPYSVNYNYGSTVPDMSNMLPPVPGISESMLYKNIDIDALTRPYSSGDNSRIDEKPVQLPDTSEVREGASRVFDHAYAPEYKNQDVVSNKEINTYTNQKHFITINNRNLHRDHKLIDVNTNYITNIQRVNHPSVLKSILNQIANKHQPLLYVKASKIDKINDSGKPVEQPIIESVTESTVVLPPIFEKPVVQKFNYDGQSEPQWRDGSVLSNNNDNWSPQSPQQQGVQQPQQEKR